MAFITKQDLERFEREGARAARNNPDKECPYKLSDALNATSARVIAAAMEAWNKGFQSVSSKSVPQAKR